MKMNSGLESTFQLPAQDVFNGHGGSFVHYEPNANHGTGRCDADDCDSDRSSSRSNRSPSLTTPQDPREIVNLAAVYNWGSQYGSANNNRDYAPASRQYARPPTPESDLEENQALRKRTDTALPCPFGEHGCESTKTKRGKVVVKGEEKDKRQKTTAGVVFEDQKALKKHLAKHGVGPMFQCLNEVDGGLCEHTTHSIERIREHCKKTHNDQQLHRKLFEVFPVFLRCEGCSEVFLHEGENEKNINKRVKRIVLEQDIPTIPKGWIFRTSSQHKVMTRWFKHVRTCKAPGALSDKGLPGPNSLLFIWAARFSIIYKASALESKFSMTFSAKAGRNTKDAHQYSQLMYSRILSATIQSDMNFIPAEMNEPLGEYKNFSYDNLLHERVDGLSPNIPLSLYLRQSLPQDLLARYAERAQEESREMSSAASSPASVDAMDLSPVLTPALTYGSNSQRSTPDREIGIDEHMSQPYEPLPSMDKLTFGLETDEDTIMHESD